MALIRMTSSDPSLVCRVYSVHWTQYPTMHCTQPSISSEFWGNKTSFYSQIYLLCRCNEIMWRQCSTQMLNSFIFFFCNACIYLNNRQSMQCISIPFWTQAESLSCREALWDCWREQWKQTCWVWSRHTLTETAPSEACERYGEQ